MISKWFGRKSNVIDFQAERDKRQTPDLSQIGTAGISPPNTYATRPLLRTRLFKLQSGVRIIVGAGDRWIDIAGADGKTIVHVPLL